jgi:tRNA uridine 5-carboxymethylaminomethyl modification enzyme
VVEQLEIAAKYQGYIDRQQDEVARQADAETTRLPRPRLHHRARPVQGSPGPPQPAQARNHRPGQPHPGHHPGGHQLLLVWLKRGELARGREEKSA